MVPFDIGQHCWLKKSFKILSSSKKLVTSFCLTNNGGIKGTFLTLMKALSIDQYAFAEVDGSDNLEDNQR